MEQLDLKLFEISQFLAHLTKRVMWAIAITQMLIRILIFLRTYGENISNLHLYSYLKPLNH